MFGRKKIRTFLVMILTTAVIFSFTVPAVDVAGAGDGVKTWYSLVAGQNTNAGYVAVTHWGDFLGVEVIPQYGWEMLECHIAVAATPEGIPHNKSGSPVPGSFQFKYVYNPATVWDGHQINLSELNLVDNDEIVIAVHAVIQGDPDTCGCAFPEETAWGSSCTGSGLPAYEADGSNWATYIIYSLK